ncbi:MAG: hypothetical protein WKG07_33190 [Hymenobacter sp.]
MLPTAASPLAPHSYYERPMDDRVKQSAARAKAAFQGGRGAAAAVPCQRHRQAAAPGAWKWKRPCSGALMLEKDALTTVSRHSQSAQLLQRCAPAHLQGHQQLV